MAQINPSSLLCRYFASGACNRGDSCTFSHDRSAPMDNICRYHLQGNCYYGSNCRYDHVNPSRLSTVAADTSKSSPSGLITAKCPTRSFRPAAEEAAAPAESLPCGTCGQGIKFFCENFTGEIFSFGFIQNEDLWTDAQINLTERCLTSDVVLAAYERVVPTSYAQAVNPAATSSDATWYPYEGTWSADNEAAYFENIQEFVPRATGPLCQYGLIGVCQLGESCQYRHGDVCEMCGCQVLDPNDPAQRENHERECAAAFERDMEYAFAVQRSAEKCCAICMETISDQIDPQKKRFGILENCLHTFCFDCIMKWRKQSRETLDTDAVRSCPECRIHSDYVIPSYIWPETDQEKTKVIGDYKSEMKKRHCKHYNRGLGSCPFGGKCWFLHALPDGKVVSLPDPKPRRKIRGDGTSLVISAFNLADFLSFSDEDDDGESDFFDEDEWMERYGSDYPSETESADSENFAAAVQRQVMREALRVAAEGGGDVALENLPSLFVGQAVIQSEEAQEGFSNPAPESSTSE